MFFNSCQTLNLHLNSFSILPHDFQHVSTRFAVWQFWVMCWKSRFLKLYCMVPGDFNVFGRRDAARLTNVYPKIPGAFYYLFLVHDRNGFAIYPKPNLFALPYQTALNKTQRIASLIAMQIAVEPTVRCWSWYHPNKLHLILLLPAVPKHPLRCDYPLATCCSVKQMIIHSGQLGTSTRSNLGW